LSATVSSFTDMQLPEPLLKALADVGYETPSPIQQATIPPLLAGRDLIGQAQTGTGKTAAFALPALARLDLSQARPQVLVLTPTRELAIQVAEAFQRYATHMPGFRILPIYGGQGYGPQLAALRRGVHVLVATPGRLIDHLDRGSIKLDALTTMVLDEADEMLRMGFVDDVEKILEMTPAGRQTALFSATIPPQIRRIADRHLRDPATVTITSRTSTATGINQRCWWVGGMHKLDALTRILEAEPFDAMIVFVRTKQATEELAERLEARGFAAAAINGDLAQVQRERTIERLRQGQIDILVATDVAARGLDVERISHVLNYDIPYDTESYVHRIGRTGRAGRSGEAILFVTPRERNLLRAIERATGQVIQMMTLPSAQAVNEQRLVRFKQRISQALESEDLNPFVSLIEEYEREHDIAPRMIAAALARLVQGDAPLLLAPDPPPARNNPRENRERAGPGRFANERFDAGRDGASRKPRFDRDSRGPARSGTRPPRGGEMDATPEPGFARYRIEVGRSDGVRPGNIVGAIANEAGLDSSAIGRIGIRENYSLVDLPENLPAPMMAHLRNVWVSGQRLKIRPFVPDAEWQRGGSEGGKGDERKQAPGRSPAGRRELRKPPRRPRD